MLMGTTMWTAGERRVILLAAQGVFFRAMFEGYVGVDGQKSIKSEKDACKYIQYTEGNFRVMDQYCVTPQSDFSAGTTTIFFQESPVWWMSYGGQYPPEVIPFLKRALAKAYSRWEFYGGRGPERYIEESLTYENHSRQGVELDSIGSSFDGFQGHEEIGITGGATLGFHHYFGMALI